MLRTFNQLFAKNVTYKFETKMFPFEIKHIYSRSSVADIHFHESTKLLPPPLNDAKHKGQAGRIGVFGGSLEYTGAPYFAAMSALKVGADLVHVFCAKDAGSVIKSYSPELIVHPILDAEGAAEKIEPWLERLHVVLIGPGLGREPQVFNVISRIIEMCRLRKKPLVIDADGLFLVAQNPDVIKDYPQPGVILTPNIMEFARLKGSEIPQKGPIYPADLPNLGENVTIVCKGAEDQILDKSERIVVAGGGSGRRCGGQGDLLAGALSIFLTWSLQLNVEEGAKHDDRPMTAAYAACRLTRECNSSAFKKNGRSMTCSDMIKEIHGVFEEHFELK